ncbi:SRPBCC family protein [Amycolatopsis sp. NBC_00348]|uniref:SRPBCC family protein n=1 Tax=unclassified Amycolatopsis TaxID=2618356 RepID=UPI002E0D82EF|nr:MULTISPECIES: SRPBCC family protein [unclassified Amycolatopsis]WSJ78810.1 SRPBCC family protein [Amycolatopsis sp. NBC_01307]
MSFEITQDIDRPPARVFAFVADVTTMPRWYEAVVRVEPADPVGPGARFRMVRSLPAGPAHNDVEVVTWVPDEEITFVSVAGPTPFRYRYRFAPTATGTRLTLEGRISAEGLTGPAGRLGGLAERFFKQGMKTNLRALARLLESATPAGAIRSH